MDNETKQLLRVIARALVVLARAHSDRQVTRSELIELDDSVDALNEMEAG